MEEKKTKRRRTRPPMDRRKMKKNVLTLLSVLAVIVVFLAVLTFATLLLEPKYATDLVEGSMISQYYDEYGGHDVIFIGDCEVYANFSPMEMYRADGITAYVRGTPQQMIWQSYYVLRETFNYETPQIVVLNVNSMRYSDTSQIDNPESYNRLTIDRMRWSSEKIGIILRSMTEDETFLSYVFPILRYHSRFDELTEEDFTYLFKTKANTYNGFLVHKEINPVENLPAKRVLPDYSFDDIDWAYLDMIRELCEEHGTELILIKAPSQYPYWYDEYNEQIVEYAEEYGLAFYNFLEYVDEIGIDYSTDTYDAGLHLNLYGAVKLSDFFADILAQNHGVTDHRDDWEVAAVYDEKLRIYDEAIAD